MAIDALGGAIIKSFYPGSEAGAAGDLSDLGFAASGDVLTPPSNGEGKSLRELTMLLNQLSPESPASAGHRY